MLPDPSPADPELEAKVARLTSPATNDLLDAALGPVCHDALIHQITTLTSNPVIAALDTALAPMAAPAGLSARIVAATSAATAEPQAPLPITRVRWRIRSRAWLFAAAAAVALTTSLSLMLMSQRTPPGVVAVLPYHPETTETQRMEADALINHSDLADLRQAVIQEYIQTTDGDVNETLNQLALHDELNAFSEDIALLDA